MDHQPLNKLEYFVAGSVDPDAQTIVMLAGWPDTAEVFRPNFMVKFGAAYRIVGVTLPGYTTNSRKIHGLKASGWTFDEVVTAFVRTLDETVPSATTRRQPILLSHDWGCIITSEFLLRRPRFFERLVMLDVAGQNSGDTPGFSVAGFLLGKHNAVPLRKLLYVLLYQTWILVAYALYVIGFYKTGHYIIKALAKGLEAPLYQRNVDDNKEYGYDGVVPEQGHLYVQLWWHLLLRRPLASVSCYHDPLVPVFYGYGTKKPFHFHTSSWLRMLASRTPRDGSMAVPYHGGHWFFYNPSSPTGAQVLQDVERFLQKS